MQRIFRICLLLSATLISQYGLASSERCGLDGDYRVEIYRYCTGGLCTGRSILLTVENDAVKGQFAVQSKTPARGVGPSFDGIFEVFLREVAPCEFVGTRERTYKHQPVRGGGRLYKLKDAFEIKKQGSEFVFSQESMGEPYWNGQFYGAWSAYPKALKPSSTGMGTPQPTEPPIPEDPIQPPAVNWPSHCQSEEVEFGEIASCFDVQTNQFELYIYRGGDEEVRVKGFNLRFALNQNGNEGGSWTYDEYIVQNFASNQLAEVTIDGVELLYYSEIIPFHGTLVTSCQVQWNLEKEFLGVPRPQTRYAKSVKTLVEGDPKIPVQNRPLGKYEDSGVVIVAYATKYRYGSPGAGEGWHCSRASATTTKCRKNVANEPVPNSILTKLEHRTVTMGEQLSILNHSADLATFRLGINAASIVGNEAFGTYTFGIPHGKGILTPDKMHKLSFYGRNTNYFLTWNPVEDEILWDSYHYDRASENEWTEYKLRQVLKN
jgi:hypothetical protein